MFLDLNVYLKFCLVSNTYCCKCYLPKLISQYLTVLMCKACVIETDLTNNRNSDPVSCIFNQKKLGYRMPLVVWVIISLLTNVS